MHTTALATLNLVDLLLDAVCVVDAQGRYLFVSPAYERIFGYAPAEVLGRPMIELVHPGDRERTLQAAQGIMAGQEQLHFENRYVRKDGRVAHIRWTARWLPDAGVRVAVAHDITHRKRHEAVQSVLYAISEAAHTAPGVHALCVQIREVIAALVPAGSFTVALFDAAARTLEFPPGLRPASCPDVPLDMATAPGYADVLRSGQAYRWTAATGRPVPWPTPGGARAPGPQACWIGVPLPGPASPGGVLALWLEAPTDHEIETDVELLQYIASHVAAAVERKRLHEQLEHMARHDLLTGLPNRARLHEHLSSALRRAHHAGMAVALLFLDLDDFKRVNDTLGHGAGDLLLRQAATRLRETLPEADLLARLGGDEFVVLLEARHCMADAQQAALQVQARIAQAFVAPFTLGDAVVAMRPSVGTACFPDDADDADALLSRADAAMYAHKHRHRATTRQG